MTAEKIAEELRGYVNMGGLSMPLLASVGAMERAAAELDRLRERLTELESGMVEAEELIRLHGKPWPSPMLDVWRIMCACHPATEHARKGCAYPE